MQVKNKEEVYEKIVSISKNNDYTTGNFLNYEYFSKHYKLIVIGLSKQIELENPDLRQQINLLASLKMIKQQCFSLLRNQKKQLLNFYKILRVSYKIEKQNIINLLNDSSNKGSKFVTKKWYVIDSQTIKGK